MIQEMFRNAPTQTSATLREQGKIQIPKELRKQLGLRAGSRLVEICLSDCMVLLSPKFQTSVSVWTRRGKREQLNQVVAISSGAVGKNGEIEFSASTTKRHKLDEGTTLAIVWQLDCIVLVPSSFKSVLRVQCGPVDLAIPVGAIDRQEKQLQVTYETLHGEPTPCQFDLASLEKHKREIESTSKRIAGINARIATITASEIRAELTQVRLEKERALEHQEFQQAANLRYEETWLGELLASKHTSQHGGTTQKRRRQI